MEHIGEIIKRRTRINTSRASTDIWSGAEEPSPRSACPVCKGAGFLHPLLPSGKPNFTQVIACRCTQQEVEKERQTHLERYSGLAELHKSMTFSSFLRRVNLPPEIQQNLEEAFRVAYDFAKSPDGWLVLLGVTGCGKTHLAAAIANERIQNGKPALLVIIPDFLDHLRSTFSPDSPVSYDQLFESVKAAPLLILDDFGEQSTTPWAQEKLYQVINHRYNTRLPTVITTRRSLDEIDDPISSRLSDAKLSNPFNIHAPDYRTTLQPTNGTKTTYRRGRKGH